MSTTVSQHPVALAWTRFVYAFSFDPGPESLRFARGALIKQGVPEGFPSPWRELGRAPQVHGDELVPQVRDYLFSGGDSDCLFFEIRSPNETGAIAMVHGAAVHATWPKRIGEVYLSDQGVGALSILVGVTPHGDLGRDPLTAEQVVSFNYNATSRHSPERFSFQARSDSPGVPVPLGPLSKVAECAAAPLAKTLPGFAFARTAPKSGEPLPFVYTCLRFGPEVDFTLEEVKAGATQLATRLAQVEESGHPDAIAGAMNTPTHFLTARHAFAVGHLGCAHLVSDEPAPPGGQPPPFNLDRPIRARDRYFTPWLVSFLQREILRRVTSEAKSVVAQPDDKRGPYLHRLRERMLRLGVSGMFQQVSERFSVQAYYEACQSALGVPTFWANAKEAIAALDSDAIQVRQEAEQARETRITGAAHRIEILLFGVYAVELVKSILEAVPVHAGPWLLTSLLCALPLGVFVAWWMIHREEREPTRSPGR